MSERLRHIDGEIVMGIIADLGYSSGFEPKEKFFYGNCNSFLYDELRYHF